MKKYVPFLEIIKIMILKLLSILPLLLLILSCRETGTSSNIREATVIVNTDSSDSSEIFIKDYTGKKWDITHAVNEYGFVAEQFQYGIGPFAIRPLLELQFLSPGDSGYHSIGKNEIVIGTVINGIARAYPLGVLWRYEIANDTFDPTHVAVGY